MNPVVDCAAAHVAKLFSGEMSEHDLRQLEEWLAEDKLHRAEYEAVLEAWDLTESLNWEFETDSVSQTDNATPWSRTIAYKIAAGFSVVIISLSAYFLTGNNLNNDSQLVADYETAVGEQRTIHLADNSTITLNTGTKIHVDFSEGKRYLELFFGEAFFDIEKDLSRPFIIDFGDRQIKVLGTKFNVLLAPSVSTVSVIEGLVSVRETTFTHMQALPGSISTLETQENEVLLKAGKSADFLVYETNLDAVVETGIDKFQDWRLRQISFDRVTLIKVVAEINRYSNHKVLIEDSTVVNFQVSGVFQIDKFDQFLQGIEAVLPVEIVHYVDSYVIVGSKK